MCGIAALYSWDPRADGVSRRELDAISERMIPRGPDAHGEWISPDGRVGLASRRLAIIDPTPDSQQPIESAETGCVIVFNGEIYNYAELRASLVRQGVTLHSHGDTEVLLRLYEREGARMLPRLRGMYAIAIWDPRDRSLFLARDPYGIKPLYFANDGRTVRIASQVKAILAGGAVSRTVDPAGAAGFFLTGSIPEPFTFHEAIRCVEAGTWLVVRESGISEAQKHYSIPEVYCGAMGRQGFARLTEPGILLRELIDESVRYHLVSDVPVGVFLSSGLDSTALTLAAQRISSQALRSFTVGFAEENRFVESEAPLAARFAAFAGTVHTTRIVTRQEFLADYDRILDQMDQPTIDGVNTWFVSKAAHEAGIKVALSGLGGDELFGGYPSFREVPRIRRIGRVAARAPRLTERLFSLAAGAGFGNPKLPALTRLGRTWGGAWLVKRGLFMPWELTGVLGRDAAEAGLARLGYLDRVDAVADASPEQPFARVAALESSFYMRNQLLRDTDWASMAHSVEVRTPLVDASLLRQLAPVLIAIGRGGKLELGAMLPSWIAEQKKIGFSIPLASWADLPPDGTSMRMRSWASRVFQAAAPRGV
jgi:asparagine synthase (glutamine-hydrolysing)